MIFMLDFFAIILPAAIAYGLFNLYRCLFVEGYVKKIKKAIDDNDMEKAEKMKAVALKRQPNKIPALLVKYKIEKEKDILEPYEIDTNGVEDGSLATLELQLNTGDSFRFDFWYLLHRSSAVFRVMWVFIFIFVLTNLIVNFSATALAVTVVLVCYWIINRIKVYSYYRKSPKYVARMEFFSDGMVLKISGKIYGIGRADIEKVYSTRKYLYAIVKNKTVIIIPKRFIPNEELSIILDCLDITKRAAVHTV